MSLPQRQTGQALPIGLALIMMGALATLVLFNTGKMASAKSNLANTADAAVYSGLIWQARSLNFQAYTNRAMVANQVSIAQLVSLGSWTNYGRISARNLDYAIGWIPVVKPFTSAALNVMTQIENVVQSGVKVAVPIINGINEVLSIAQEAVYNASYLITPEVVSTVVMKNDSRMRAKSTYALSAMVRSSAAWHNFSSRYSGSSTEMQRKVDVINASRDEFSRERSWDRLPGLPSKIYVTPIDRFKIVKEGGARLIHSGDDWEWRGKDSLSVHWEHFSCGFTGCGWDHNEIPMGWGSNYAYSNSDCPGGDCRGWFEANGIGEELADIEGEDLGSVYSGVKSYRSLKDLSRNNRDPRLTLHVEVELANADIRTAEKIELLGSPSAASGQLETGLERGLFYTDDVYTAGAIASMSSGEVFFDRPVLEESDKLRVEGQGVVQEYANLFNPYWEVRLIEVSEAERQLAWITRDPGLSGGAVASYARSEAVDVLAQQPALNAAHYAALAGRALDILDSGLLEQAVEDQALNALKNIATNALSSYTSSSFGGVGEFASGALADGEISSEDLLAGAKDALGDQLQSSQLGDAIAIGEELLGGDSDLSSVLLTQAGIADAGEYINEQLQAIGSDIGEDILASLNESFAAEIDIADQIESLGDSLGELGDNFGAQVDDIASQLKTGAQDQIGAQLDQLEQELKDTYGDDFEIDRSGIIDSFDSSFRDIAEGLVGESSEAFSSTLDELKDSIAEQFSAIDITPSSVENGVYQAAQTAIGEQASLAQEQLEASLNEAGEQITEVTEDQIDSALEDAQDDIERTINDYRGRQEDSLRGRTLPPYEG